mgnify:CR=1 FL=1
MTGGGGATPRRPGGLLAMTEDAIATAAAYAAGSALGLNGPSPSFRISTRA